MAKKSVKAPAGKTAKSKTPAPKRAVIPATVHGAALCNALSIHRNTLMNLCNDGVLQRDKDGNFALVPSIKAYVAYRESIVKERTEKPKVADDLQQVRRDKIARAMAREERNLIELTEALDIVDQIIGRLVAFVIAIPARLSRDRDERERIQGILDDGRNKLADDFAKIRLALQTGGEPSEAEDED